ncbi:MAG TPA: PspC domain-containing protein [Streptosporangiaceae bacterium]
MTGTDRGSDMGSGTRPRELRRTRKGRMIAGVCSGVAEYFDMDANIIRLALVVLTLFTAGTAAGVYVAAWLLIPEEGERNSIVQDLLDKQRDKRGQ